MQLDYKEFKREILKNEDVKLAYDELEPEYQLICEMLRCRKEQQMSQQDLADATGIDRADISKLENGNANPSLQTIKKIAKGLDKKVQIEFV